MKEAGLESGEAVVEGWKRANLDLPTCHFGTPHVLRAILEQRQQTGLSISQIKKGYEDAGQKSLVSSLSMAQKAHQAYEIDHELSEGSIQWAQGVFWNWSMMLAYEIDEQIKNYSFCDALLIGTFLERWKRYKGDRLTLLLSTVQAITAVYEADELKSAMAEYRNIQRNNSRMSNLERLAFFNKRSGDFSREMIRDELGSLGLNDLQVKKILNLSYILPL